MQDKGVRGAGGEQQHPVHAALPFADLSFPPQASFWGWG